MDTLSRPFDPHWTTELPVLVGYLDDLCRTVTATENRMRKRSKDSQAKFDAAIQAIVLDLFRAQKANPSLEVGIPSGQSALAMRCKSQYGASLLAPRSFRAAIKALKENGFIVETTPFWDDPSGKNSRTARYQASPELLAALEDSGASAVTLIRHRGVDGIRLKDAEKNLVEYGESSFVKAAGDRLRIINDMLEGHWADLALTDEELTKESSWDVGSRDDEAAPPFDFAARTVYRVFNNCDWEQGGRFYGAWWMACPSKLRRYILIDGKRTVEVDYSGLHAAMLFAKAGLPIPDDPYERCLTRSGSVAERSLVKRTFNALLNAKHIKALSPIEGFSEGLTGKNWPDFINFVVSCYPEFSQSFGSGIGLRLQCKDSQLAETVMLQFASKGYACLPVHDSFIVHHGLQDDLAETMQAAFEAEFGAKGKVSFELGEVEPVEPSSEPIAKDIGVLLHQEGYDSRLQDFFAYMRA